MDAVLSVKIVPLLSLNTMMSVVQKTRRSTCKDKTWAVSELELSGASAVVDLTQRAHSDPMPVIGMMINVITATELVIMRAIVVVIAGNVVLGRVHPAVIRERNAVIRVPEVVLLVENAEVIGASVVALLAVVTVALEAVSVITAVVAKKIHVIANLVVMILIGSVHPPQIGSVEYQKAPMETATGTSRSSSVKSGTSRSVSLARIGSHKTATRQLEKIGSNATLLLTKVETRITVAAMKSTTQLPKATKMQGSPEEDAVAGTSPMTQRMLVYGCE